MTKFLTFTVSSLLCGLSLLASPAMAQSSNAVAKAFAGRWVTYDSHFAEKNECIFDFSANQKNEIFPIQQSNCAGELKDVTGWKILNNQLVFVAANNAPVALVGGNQERLSGATTKNKLPVILERLEIAQKIQEARKSIACSYVGYSQLCAKPQDFTPPNASPQSPALVKVLVNLNARMEPRNSAKVVTVLKPNACLKAETCTVASDGLWCRVNLGQSTAWIKKQAVRQKRWPIITFKNGC
ncbi:hypothetical protein [uncultured Cohaesibacter sp.]|uniref:hypothetical protein n=1 Tax=uncultured Cohaesibacter sp. TaxID=1002546 RepID=UPI002931A8CA|nr:hypothetical protein [uncultured Cohaesibacter sp.]